MPKRFSSKTVKDSYLDHPVQMKNVLRRIAEEKKGNVGLTAGDLAYDAKQGLTDQNHIGGADYVIEIGRRLGIREQTRVLELGCGIGGAARVLAAEFNCHVTGVDLAGFRIADARELSKLCGLGRKNLFLEGDFNSPPRGAGKGYDVLLSQNSLVHAPSPRRVLRKWVPLLKPQGKVAIEEVFLRASPTLRQARLVERLQVIWNSYLHPLSTWEGALRDAGREFQTFENLTAEMHLHFELLARHHEEHGAQKSEQESYSLALTLAKEGVLGYFRVISTAGKSA